ncbi:MAG TPA: DEAD/DEAH box helicase [Candidatus Omnitrophota bacterium]|nr:DEAD/DEAH box helicase [Candidatus Omnitrophota bacterium]
MNIQQSNFYGLGIAPQLLETLLKLKFHTPTPIQHQAIPIALEGKDIIGIAQTGTGKTMAFGIPMLQRLTAHKGRGLVLVPTRELAVQVKEAIDKIAHAFHLRTAVFIGGDPIHLQIKALQRDPRVLIATPGRLIDLVEQRKLNLGDVSILVLDEADRMLDMGFAPQIERILRMLPRARQTMLFSATMPQMILKIAAQHMNVPLQVEVAPSGTAPAQVTHELFIVQKEKKMDLLKKTLEKYRGSVLMFCRTRRGATRTTKSIRNMGFNAAEIHSDRTQAQRQRALEAFRLGKIRILVATDIASRGIDVTGIELVINYDLPDETENYVHRIGRTGRAGRAGHAISFAMPDQRQDVMKIENLIKKTLPVSQHHPDISSTEFNKPQKVFSYNRFRSRAPQRRRRR